MNQTGVTLIWILSSLCFTGTPASRNGAQPVFTVPPTIAANPNPRVPLAAIVRFDANVQVSASISVSTIKVWGM